MITFYYKALDVDVELPEDPPCVFDILIKEKVASKEFLPWLLKQGCSIKAHDPESKGYDSNYLTLDGNRFIMDLQVGFLENDDCKDTKIEFFKEVCDFVGDKVTTEELEKLAKKFNVVRLHYIV